MSIEHRLSRCFAIGIAGHLFFGGMARAENLVELRLTESPRHAFPLPSEPDAAPALPFGTESVWVVGRFSLPDFSVADPNRIALQKTTGEPLEWIVETDTLFREFDEIVAFGLAFRLPASEAEAGTTIYLRWSDAPISEPRPVDRITIGDSASSHLLGFTVAQPPDDANDTFRPVASIRVIADSTVDYSFLGYLLPMGILFTLLTLRKIRANYPLHR